MLVTDQVKRSFPGGFALVRFRELLVDDSSGTKAPTGIISPQLPVMPTQLLYPVTPTGIGSFMELKNG